jgi:hypothetical protein
MAKLFFVFYLNICGRKRYCEYLKPLRKWLSCGVVDREEEQLIVVDGGVTQVVGVED